MAGEPDERVVDFSTLFVAADWIEHHCVVPDGFDEGAPFELYDWQLWFLLNHYRVKPDALPAGSKRRVAGELREVKPASAFHFRRSQIVLPQKAGKAPITAAQVCLEGVGPAIFAGWAAAGDVYRCADWGCRCGWRYAYEPGEAMGRPWPTPLIQITATSEEQTDNIYDALRPMIELGPLAQLIPKTGEEFIRLPRGGRIDVVTSNARSRLGQRVTFVPQDETGIWTPLTGMVKVAETQRRGLSGMGGRAVETTNAWDPAEDSVAKRTASSKSRDIFRLHPEAPADLKYRRKADRRRIHEIVYAGCLHVDLDSIEAEAAELLEEDPAQAERFFGNRVVAGDGKAFSVKRWGELARPKLRVPRGAVITIGVDGARFDDALAVVATAVRLGHQWPLGIWERPESAPDGYEHPLDEIDGVMADAFDQFDVWRTYIDPQYIDHLVALWRGRWGEQRIVPWYTNRPKQMAHALAAYHRAMTGGDLTHDGDPTMGRHIANAVRRPVNVRDDQGQRMWVVSKETPMSPLKIDGSMAGALAWEARSDCIAAGTPRSKPKSRAMQTSRRKGMAHAR